MRYYRIEFLDDAVTPGFMETDNGGNFTRLVDLNGTDIQPYPNASYRTLDLEPVDPIPVWGSLE